MVKMSGLNMLNSVKAGAQQRSSSPITKDSARETFKDVLGYNDEKSKSEQNLAKPVQLKSQRPQAGAARRQKEEGPATYKSMNMSEKSSVDSTEEKSLLWDAQEKSAESVESMETVDASDAGADSMPGAPEPSTGVKTGPDFSMISPSLLGVTGPIANKSKETTGNAQVDSLTRRAVWSDFLRRMHEELGVSAEKVLAAFSTLTEKELSAPPEENVDKLVMALGLNSDQSQLAHKMFTDLIRKTQSKSLGEELASSSSTINLSLMSQRDLQRRQLQTALDKMNSAFFMSKQGKLAQQPVQDKNAALAADGSVLAPELGAEYAESAASLTVPAATAPVMAPTLPAAQPMTAQGAKLNELVKQMEPMTDDEIAEYTQAMSKNNAQMYAHAPKAPMFAAPSAAAATPAATSAASAGSEGAEMTAKAFAQALGLSSGGDQSSAGDDSSKEDGSEASLMNQVAIDRNIQAPKTDAKFQLSPTEPQQAPVQMGVPDLINHARIMVREGGGEMKVSLTPEGMGEVNMKVSVENGRVNVEMITESDTAKNLIEKGLVDLKSSLHANNLSVDTIKVDTASNLGKQLDQQYQDAQRQQARSFLENFRQNDQGWRRENFVTPSAQMSRSQSQAGTTTPYPTNKRANAARRLDLVA